MEATENTTQLSLIDVTAYSHEHKQYLKAFLYMAAEYALHVTSVF